MRRGFKLNLRNKIKMGPMSLTYLAVIAFFAIGFVYVLTVNVVSNKGTTLRLLELENKGLVSENDRLEVEAARLKSLRVIEDNASGEVHVGDLEAPKEENLQPVAIVPKLVPTRTQQYLPSYSQLAQR